MLAASTASIDRFVDAVWIEQGLATNTLVAYRRDLTLFADWLGREHGLTAVQAYLLCSVAVDLRISEIVDMPNVIVTAHCPLGLFD